MRVFVLIDALGWRIVQKHKFLADILPFRQSVRTILGFSSGAIPTILTGLPPSEHQHWNLYYYDPKNSPFRWLKPLSFLPDGALNHRVGKKVMKELGRRVLGLGPLFECCVSPRLLPYFNWVEKRCIYGLNGITGAPSIFDQLSERNIPFHVYSYHQDSDENLLAKAQRDLETDPAPFFFIYLSELDALLHQHPDGGPELESKLAWYEKELRRVFDLAKAQDRDASFAVMSDHGMTSVRKHFELVGEIDKLGYSMPRDYLAVYDSTMGRYWFFNENARREITAKLRSISCIRLLSEEQQQDLGIWFPDRRYGETIALLDPGWLLAKSDFNGKGWNPKGMHGYHPDDPDSDAVFLSSQKPAKPLSSIADIHACMKAGVFE